MATILPYNQMHIHPGQLYPFSIPHYGWICNEVEWRAFLAYFLELRAAYNELAKIHDETQLALIKGA